MLRPFRFTAFGMRRREKRILVLIILAFFVICFVFCFYLPKEGGETKGGFIRDVYEKFLGKKAAPIQAPHLTHGKWRKLLLAD